MQLSDMTDLVITGTVKGEEVGDALSIGDIDGDGNNDLVVGASGAGFTTWWRASKSDLTMMSRMGVFYGPLTSSNEKMKFDDANYIVEAPGTAESEYFGGAVGIGDVDGDGANDIAVGGMGIVAGSRIGAGQVSVIKGPFDRQQNAIPKIDTEADAHVAGEFASDRLGSAGTIADINGDGTTDLILGAKAADSLNGEETGTVSVMFGNIFDREPIPEASGTGSITVFAIIGVVAVVGVAGGFWYLRRKRKAPEAS